MARFLVFALLFAVPQAGGADYQKKANAVKWPGGERAPVLFGTRLGGYELELGVDKDGWKSTVSKGGKALYSWVAEHPAGFIHKGVLYRAVYSQGSNGCEVLAYDLKAGKQLWRARLKGVGWNRPRSLYYNVVCLDLFDGQALIVYGEETYGRYVEIVALSSGKTLGHRVVSKAR